MSPSSAKRKRNIEQSQDRSTTAKAIKQHTSLSPRLRRSPRTRKFHSAHGDTGHLRSHSHENLLSPLGPSILTHDRITHQSSEDAESVPRLATLSNLRILDTSNADYEIPNSRFPLNEHSVDAGWEDIVKIPGENSSKPSTVVQGEGEPTKTKRYCSMINILVKNDPDGADRPWVQVKLDTQAEESIMFESQVKKLDLECIYMEKLGSYKGLGPGEVKCIGWVHIDFTFKGAPAKVYNVKVDVLEDFSDDHEHPPFNILLGNPTLTRYGLVTIDSDKIPDVHYAYKKSH